MDKFPKRVACVASYYDPSGDVGVVVRMSVVVSDIADSSHRLIASLDYWLKDYDLADMEAEIDAYLGDIQGDDLAVMHVSQPMPLQKMGVNKYGSHVLYREDFLNHLRDPSLSL